MTDQRPIYENGTTLAAERQLAELVGARWNCTAIKQPRHYAVDYALMRDDGIVALMEVKTRPNYQWAFFDRGGYRISAHKWLAAQQFAGLFGVPFILMVSTADSIRYATIKAPQEWQPDGFIWAGRNDRGDWQDKEPHAVLNGARFKELQP